MGVLFKTFGDGRGAYFSDGASGMVVEAFSGVFPYGGTGHSIRVQCFSLLRSFSGTVEGKE